VSYGTHFFQDLVEADIAILPLYPDNPGSVLREEFLLESENSIASLDPSLAEHAGIVHVIHVPAVRGGQYLHVYLDGEGQKGAGTFGRPTPASAG
jgi:pyruvate,water dikinase